MFYIENFPVFRTKETLKDMWTQEGTFKVLYSDEDIFILQLEGECTVGKVHSITYYFEYENLETGEIHIGCKPWCSSDENSLAEIFKEIASVNLLFICNNITNFLMDELEDYDCECAADENPDFIENLEEDGWHYKDMFFYSWQELCEEFMYVE